jgi:hypothetical protein
MTTSGPTEPKPTGTDANPSAAGFAIPARLHVILLFMTQLLIVLALFGGVVPAYYEQGVNIGILVAGSAASLIAVHLALGGLGRLVPVRCHKCRSRSYFGGFGWWPFTYRYACSTCGHERRLEIQG